MQTKFRQSLFLSCFGFVVLTIPSVADAYGYQSQYSYQYQYQYQYEYEYQYPTPVTTFTGDVTTGGDLSITEKLTKGSGTFVIDHPLDPANKLLFHSFVESPDVKNIYDGTVTLDRNGEAAVSLPNYFEALNRDFRYQLKPIDRSMPNLYIAREVEDNRFAIAGGEPGGRVSWQVTGIRHDPYILANPIEVEVEKGPEQLVERGEYLFQGLSGRNAGFAQRLRDFVSPFFHF